jgi:transposase
VVSSGGRESGHLRLTVTKRSDGETLEQVVRRATWPKTKVNTDEWGGYNGLPAMGRDRSTVCHADKEWARDDDGDGIREVHINTMEGLWTGMRNFLRLFRGVSKKYLYQYVAMFEWGYNVKRATSQFLGDRRVRTYPARVYQAPPDDARLPVHRSLSRIPAGPPSWKTPSNASTP